MRRKFAIEMDNHHYEQLSNNLPLGCCIVGLHLSINLCLQTLLDL
jgi:hypothetical protein